MSKILQFVYFICYGLAALAIAFVAPKIFPETPRAVAWLAGAVVFLAGALMHEIASRCYQVSLDRHRIALLHRAYTEAMEDVDRLAAEIRTLKRTGAHYALTPEPPDIAGTVDAPPEPLGMERPEPAGMPEGQATPPPGADVGTAEGKLAHSLVQRLFKAPVGNTAAVSGSLFERETLNAVREALRQGKLDLYVQPIVTLPQRKPRHFDCEARLISDGGDYMPPAMYQDILRANELTLPVNDMLLFRTVERAVAMTAIEPGGYAFCRVAPESLSDRAFFSDFTAYLREADDLVSRVVFEFREADVVDLDEIGADALGTLVDLGYLLCISQLHNFDVDANQLADGGVRFVKVDAEMLAPAMSDESEFARVRRFKSGLDNARIDLIVTGLANEQLLVELLDLDVEFGEGPLFGDLRKGDRPAAVAESKRGRA